MKKIMIILLFSLLLNSLSMIQAESICSRLILEYNQKFQDKPIIIETRLFQHFGRQQFFVNFINQSTNKSTYSDMIVRLLYKYKNNRFQLAAYDITDYANSNCLMLDKTKKMLFSWKIDKEEILFNKRKKLEKIKARRFNLDYYTLPYLGRKYLGGIKRVSEDVYELNKIKVAEGLAVFMDLSEPISAKFTIEASRIIESYHEQSKRRMIRIIEASPEKLDLNDLDTLARIAQTKLKAYYPLSEEKID